MFQITKQLGYTFYLSDEAEIEILVDLEKKYRQLRSGISSRSCVRCSLVLLIFMGCGVGLRRIM